MNRDQAVAAPSPPPASECAGDNETEAGAFDRADSAAADDQESADARLRWALADLENLRKRYERDLEQQLLGERARVVREWLPVLDNLERALDYVREGDDGLVEGLRAVRDQASHVLSRLGFSRYEDVGCPFDPSRHEAVGALESDAPPGTILTAVRPGYARDDFVLRPAGVIVSKGRD